MRLLVLAIEGIEYEANKFTRPHIFEAWPRYLAQGVASAGHDVWYAALTRQKPYFCKKSNLTICGWDVDARKFDAVTIVNLLGFARLKMHKDLYRQVQHHKLPTMVSTQWPGHYPKFDPEETRFVKLFGIHTPFGTFKCRDYYKDARAEVVRFGVTNVPMNVPSPYKGPGRRVFYHGVLCQADLDFVNHLAASLGGSAEVWVAFSFRKPDGTKALTDEDRQKMLNPHIRLVSDVLGTLKVGPKFAGHGPVIYGKHFPWLVHSDVGLSFSAGSRIESVHSKTVENLGAGLPTAAEAGTQNNGELLNYHCGHLWDLRDKADMVRCVQRILREKWDRPAIRQAALAEHGWDQVGWRWGKLLEDSL